VLDRIVADVAFVTELATAGCITWPQREHLINIIQPRDRNEKLTEFLTRRSVAEFHKFISVLAKEHDFLVPLFLTNGGELLLPSDALRCTVFVIVFCLSVCHTRGLCSHGSTYDHDFFTIW